VLEPPWCERCGCPSALPVPACSACPPSPVTSCRARFRYEGPARAAVHRLKFSGWRIVGAALAVEIARLPLPEVDVVAWVPLARRRRAERGFDQAHALAKALGGELRLPTRRLVRRVRSTDRQAPPPRRPRVLLVDDVVTTGATAAACAEALVAAGAREVHLAAAARSLPRAALQRAAPGADNRVGSRSGLWLPGDPPR
jgi:predicted amidophosphoribosyltransferase